MRFYTVLASRPAYYDRNAVDKTNTYGANGVAPHTSTVRWTYTVPSAKKAFITTSSVLLMRDSAPTTAGAADGHTSVVPVAGSEVYLGNVREVQANVGLAIKDVFSPQVQLAAGDQFLGTTSDASTGGSYHMRVGGFVTEFDA